MMHSSNKDSAWKNRPASDFILYWKNQLRLYENLVPPSDWLKDNVKRTLLENAVHDSSELRAVKNQAEQFKARDGKDFTYSEYLSLLNSAAQQLDAKFRPVVRTPRRTVYAHDLQPDADDDDPPVFSPVDSFDMDTDANVLEAYQSLTTPSRTRLFSGQWRRLSPEDQAVWDQLSDDAKRIVLEASTPPNRRPPPRGSSTFSAPSGRPSDRARLPPPTRSRI